jgi:hypothetical protein
LHALRDAYKVKSMAITLVVRGNRQQARAAARARGIPFSVVKQSANDTTGRTTCNMQRKLYVWSVEDLRRGAPYPVGSLLQFNPQACNTGGGLSGTRRRRRKKR